MHNLALESFWIAFAVAAVVAWPTLALLRAAKSSSVISPYAPEGHQAKAGTPNMGGILMIIAMSAVLIYFADFGVGPLFVLLLGFAVIGFIDDYVIPKVSAERGLKWLGKLLMQFAVAGLYVASAGISSETLLTAFFIVFFANAVNFSDGLDALAGSLLFFSTIPFGVYFVTTMDPLGAVVSFGIAGSVVPFLFLNAPPARVFMGDVGALAFGALVGYLFAQTPWQTSAWPWIVSLILVIELVLVPIQIVAVKTLKKRVFPSTPIHHGFEIMGWPESRIVWHFMLAQVLLSVAAITLILT